MAAAAAARASVHAACVFRSDFIENESRLELSEYTRVRLGYIGVSKQIEIDAGVLFLGLLLRMGA